MTAVANSAFTAAQFNTHVRDNLNETPAAKATAAGRIYVSTGANQIAERAPTNSNVGTAETTTSTSYTDLTTAGPSVTVTTGARAIVMISASIWCSAAAYSYMSYEVSGATSSTAVDAKAAYQRIVTGGDANEGPRCGVTNGESALTPGSNIFTAKYRTTAGTARFTQRHMVVIPL